MLLRARGRFLHLALCMPIWAVHLTTDAGAVTRGTVVHLVRRIHNKRKEPKLIKQVKNRQYRGSLSS